MRNEYGVVHEMVRVEIAEKDGEVIPVVLIGHETGGNSSTNRMPMSWESVEALHHEIGLLLYDKKYGFLSHV